MADHVGGSSLPLRRRLHATACGAAAILLLTSVVAACSPEPSVQDPSDDSGSTASGPVEPSPSDGGGSDDATSAASDPPDEGDDDGTAGGAGGDGGVDEGDTGAPDSDPSATDDWQAPDDPAAEGPTAAPALPEVNGEIGESVALPTEATISLISITTTTLEAETPGEYVGPAVVVEVQVQNDSDAAQGLDSATVSLEAEDGELGIPTWAAPNAPLQGEVPSGATAAGTYVFMLDPADSRSVTVRVNYSAGEPVAVFTGTTP